MTTEEEIITRLEGIEQRLSMLIHPCNGRIENLQEQIIEAQGMALDAMRKAKPRDLNSLANTIEFGGCK